MLDTTVRNIGARHHSHYVVYLLEPFLEATRGFHRGTKCWHLPRGRWSVQGFHFARTTGEETRVCIAFVKIKPNSKRYGGYPLSHPKILFAKGVL